MAMVRPRVDFFLVLNRAWVDDEIKAQEECWPVVTAFFDEKKLVPFICARKKNA